MIICESKCVLFKSFYWAICWLTRMPMYIYVHGSLSCQCPKGHGELLGSSHYLLLYSRWHQWAGFQVLNLDIWDPGNGDTQMPAQFVLRKTGNGVRCRRGITQARKRSETGHVLGNTIKDMMLPWLHYKAAFKTRKIKRYHSTYITKETKLRKVFN